MCVSLRIACVAVKWWWRAGGGRVVVEWCGGGWRGNAWTEFEMHVASGWRVGPSGM